QAAFRENDPRKAKSRQPPIAEQKALRRHRGPRASSDRSDRSDGTEVVHPINSEGTCPRKPKIVTALPSYIRQRLSDIRRGWCPSRTPRNQGSRGWSVPTQAKLTACR